MAGAILDDVDYEDVTGARNDDESSAQAQVIPLSKQPPGRQFRVLKGHVMADLEASAKWRKQADDDFGFVSGDQLNEEDKQLLDEQGRPHVVFNRIETIIRAIAGMEVNGRHEIQYLPRNNADAAKNELLSAGSKWMGDGCDAEDEESEAFQESLVTGMGWAESRYSYEDEPEGSYIEEQIDCREMVADRTARKKNLRDARRMARLRRIPIGDAKMMFPGKSRLQIDAGVWANSGFLSEVVQKSIEERRIRSGDNSEDDFDDRNEVTVVVIQWKEKEVYYRVVDEATNQITDYTEAQHATMVKRLRMIGAKAGATPVLHARKATRWAYFQAFLGSEGLLDPIEPAPLGKQFSWACITGMYDKKKRMWYGLIRAMRDPQLWANKFMSQIMHVMNSTAKGGILAEADAFDDQREAEEGYALPDIITWVAPGALSGQKPKIIPKPGGGDASAYVNLLQYAIQSITAVTGINLELLGQQDQDQPGIVEHMRKQAGMTVLATLFDSLRGFLKFVGRKRLFLLQTRVPDGTLIRVAGQDYAGVVQMSKDKTTGQFDVVVDDAPTSPNQKDANWQVMQPLLAVFKEQLAANPELLLMALEYSPLPAPFVSAMKKVLLQQKMDPQAQADQAQMKQLAISKLVAEINKDQSIAEMNNAKGSATSATATYDLAMAQNLLTKNSGDSVTAHMQAVETAAKAEAQKANAIKTHVQAQREAIGMHHDIQDRQGAAVQQHSDMADAATNRTVDVHKALTDRIHAHIAHKKLAIDAEKSRNDLAIAAHQAQTARMGAETQRATGFGSLGVAAHKAETDRSKATAGAENERAKTGIAEHKAHTDRAKAAAGAKNEQAKIGIAALQAETQRKTAEANTDIERKKLSPEGHEEARQAPDGNWYVPDADRPGKYLQLPKQKARQAPDGKWYIPDPKRAGKYLEVRK